MPDYRDPNYYVLRVRTDEWAARQTVSLFDLSGVSIRGAGRKKARALASGGIATVEKLMETPTEELVLILAKGRVCASLPDKAREMVEGWKAEISALWEERGGPQREV